ncbi:MAG: NADH:ubiquinone oxidoreductase subunit N [Gammaproteobacteria bacterium RIFCSPHIGHO2_12_FULL_42_13]|nr:MAG: NADH:ubiquinone oxidoreductase subunit N [Gammaproteobacteria bacterium RIFCSPHIGHO2_12_FULL_42_13]
MEFLSFSAIFPESCLLIFACAVLMLGVFARSGAPSLSYFLSQIGLLLAVCLLFFFPMNAGHFSELLTVDRLSVALQVCVIIAVLFSFHYANHYNQMHHLPAAEFYVLGLLSTIGMLLLVATSNMMMLFLGLELMALPVYTMTAMMRSKMRSVEAGMKYFVIGALASGLLLYGFSLLYGVSQSLELSQIATAAIAAPAQTQLVFYFGLVFVIIGIAFKLGAAPFHAWVPDIYDGAPNSTTLFISAAPKLAAFGFAVRFLMDLAPQLHIHIQLALILIALLSIAIGNVAGIVQGNIKRLLAYSSIAHIGYITLGFACGTARGDSAAFFYIITYALTSLGTFGMLALLAREGLEMNELADFSGLAQRQPWMAFMMLLMMFSLSGVPPLVGFIAKVGILEALIQVHSAWLAVIAIIFSIIGSYYYIHVVKVMYFEDVPENSALPQISVHGQWAMTMNGLLVLGLGVFPGQLFLLCRSVF